MHRKLRPLWISLSASALLTALACSGATPLGPEVSSTGSSATDAAADGSTLKATAPTPQSPTNNPTLETLRPTLQASSAVGRFANTTFSYEFELLTASGALVLRQILPSPTWTIPSDLQYNTAYSWRVRAILGNAFGPWSSTATFRTFELVLPGCINGVLADAKAYFFHLINRREGDPAHDWYEVLQRSGLPAGPVAGVRIPDNAPFYGLTQQIDSSGTQRGRIFLPTNAPDEFGYFIEHIEVLSDPSGSRWIWQHIGTAGGSRPAPPYAPRACP